MGSPSGLRTPKLSPLSTTHRPVSRQLFLSSLILFKRGPWPFHIHPSIYTAMNAFCAPGAHCRGQAGAAGSNVLNCEFHGQYPGHHVHQFERETGESVNQSDAPCGGALAERAGNSQGPLTVARQHPVVCMGTAHALVLLVLHATQLSSTCPFAIPIEEHCGCIKSVKSAVLWWLHRPKGQGGNGGPPTLGVWQPGKKRLV